MPIIQPRPSHATLAPCPATLGWARWSLRAVQQGCDLLLTWQERSRQRHHLAALNDHMLRDIGLTRADVMAETTKPFWQG
jgi:uncharacterized protein YjiS (DUF1127 family)